MKFPSNSDRWLVLGLCISLAAVIWVVFGQTVHYGFVNFDDDIYVYNNPNVEHGLSLKGVTWAFTHVHSSNWHPVTWLSHMLDCQCYGLNPYGHHLTNILLHTATAMLLFLVLRQMTGCLWRCAFVAAVFAIHPLRVESVAWVAERKDVLSGFFFMLTIGAYVAYARNARAFGYYILTVLMMALALMSKPMVVTLPFLLLLLDYWPLNRFNLEDSRGIPRSLILEKIPLLALSGAVCLITIVAQKGAMSSPPLFLRLGNALVSYVVYIQQMIFPANLAVLYPFPDNGLAPSKIVMAAVCLIIISSVAVAARRRQPWLLFGWLWYLVALVPVIGMFQVGTQAHADRYTYLPQIGLYIALAWAVADLCAGRLYRRVIAGVVSTATVLALTLSARVQTTFWQNGKTLWTHALACASPSLTAHINLGNALLEEGGIDDAMVQYQKALQFNPENADANVSFGYALIQKGMRDEASIYLLKALEINPDNAAANNDLGIISFEKGNSAEAIAHFEKALLIKPDYPEASYNFGNALFQQGDLADAVIRYEQALQSKPGYVEACYNLGNAFFRQGKIDDAIIRYQEALRIKPDHLSASYNLGMAFKQKGRMDEAVVQFRKVVKLQPESAEAYYNLGDALVQNGKEAEAITNLHRAVEINPDYSDAANDLAWELATAPQASVRNGSLAVELAQHANQLANGKDLDVLDTLAAAYAEAGRFDDAVKTMRKAIELDQSLAELDRLAQLNRELHLYESNLPFHQESK
jgi:tetratricopeptide (TPR) repeat protein